MIADYWLNLQYVREPFTEPNVPKLWVWLLPSAPLENQVQYS